MHAIHAQLQTDLESMPFYFCPHLADRRLPLPQTEHGMIEQATQKFAIDLENSWMIGDKGD
jgi:histidinol phosphatase-like enzyme